ncbi:hypothetical protein FDP41_013442 [Naegleria fowleri]|uniref:Protein kinase domain-containing protein n=1 Tax=Naegleria fowleri TaxID=5763 RepID=A0A6A5C2W2_NAEFO|nr:uncharacterized protein FDP41_013442 [Naegleria fowleri]KAF0980228.1 hypothetical protein FDP41_013442 [Naegleria fowleri]
MTKKSSGSKFRLPFFHISSKDKTIMVQSTSNDADDVDIRVFDPEFKVPSSSTITSPSLTSPGGGNSTSHMGHVVMNSNIGHNGVHPNHHQQQQGSTTIHSPGSAGSTPHQQFPSSVKTPTTPISEEDVERVLDTVKVIDEPEEASSVKSTKGIGVLDVLDPRVDEYIVAESVDHIKKCKQKLSAKPVKLRLEENKQATVSFEDQMGWIEMKVLGSGAFGEVKMVYDRIHSKTFAVKKIHFSKAQKEYKEKIEKEIQVMQSLDHPNIVKCYGYHEHGEFFYIMMELMLGGSLKSVMKRIGKGLTEDVIQDYAKQIFSALVYIHEELPTHVYHRDLKCDNFLLAGNLIKIADFGEAKVIQKGQTFSQTRNSVVGTITFCSPEMLRGDPTYKRSHAPDIWSMGMAILEMIHGYNVWEREFRKSILSDSSDSAETDNEALYSEYRLIDFILKNLHLLQEKIIPELTVSDELKDLLLQCLKEDPSQRPKASELLKHQFFSKTFPRGTLKEEILAQFHFFTDECEKLQQKALPTYHSTIFDPNTKSLTQKDQEEPEYSADYFE